MTTDYDAPRERDVEQSGDSTLAEFKTRRTESRTGVSDIGEAELVGSPGLAGLDTLQWPDDDLSVTIVPRQEDEFICSRCYLVHHRSNLAGSTRPTLICRDCV